jgi:hypothetical protein
VAGLSSTTGVESNWGWLYACNTRAGNSELWKHFYINVLAPFIKLLRDKYPNEVRRMQHLPHPPSNDTSSSIIITTHHAHYSSASVLVPITACMKQFRHFVYMDGEHTQLIEAADPEVQAIFKGLETDICKGGPALTKSSQACDRAENFKDERKGIETYALKGKGMSGNETLEKSMVEYHTHMQEAKFGGRVVASAAFKDKLLRGLSLEVYTLQNGGYHTVEKNAEGWLICGQHTPKEGPSEPIISDKETIDAKLILAGVGNALTLEDKRWAMANTAELAAIMRQQGRLTSKQCDDAGMPKGEGAYNVIRDDLTPSRQHACCLTPLAPVWSQYQADRSPEAIEAKRVAKDKAKAEERRVQEAAKLVDKVERQAAKKAQDLANKAAFDALPKAQQDAVKAEKKRVAAEKSAQKKAQAAAAVESAQRLLAEEAARHGGDEEGGADHDGDGDGEMGDD